MRNLDITTLRSFVAVADTGGVTKAAGLLHLTQSAVSMQLKRLEESLDAPLLDRTGRGIALTAQGEQLLSYARRMLVLNDEVYGKLTSNAYEGEVTLGVPHVRRRAALRRARAASMCNGVCLRCGRNGVCALLEAAKAFAWGPTSS